MIFIKQTATTTTTTTTKAKIYNITTIIGKNKKTTTFNTESKQKKIKVHP
jgi:hypothetical protein